VIAPKGEEVYSSPLERMTAGEGSQRFVGFSPGGRASKDTGEGDHITYRERGANEVIGGNSLANL